MLASNIPDASLSQTPYARPSKRTKQSTLFECDEERSATKSLRTMPPSQKSLNAMKSGVQLCGDFNFGDVKGCLKGNEERGCVEEEI